MTSLEAELRGELLPEFTLVLPVGWQRNEPTEEVRDDMLAAAKQQLMKAHRPDLLGQTVGLVNKLFSEMHRVETVAFFSPGPDAPDQSHLPASLTASVRRGENGQSLDNAIAGIINREGATRLGEDKRFLRWEKCTVEKMDNARISTTTVMYLTPVPGTGRKRALQFTLVITHNPEAPGDEEFVADLSRFFDAHISTFTWKIA